MAGARRIPIQFGFQSKPGRYIQDGSNRIINAVAEDLGESGKSPVVLYVSEGLRPLLTLPTFPNRGFHECRDYCYVASGAKVYRVSKSWEAVEVGTLYSSAGPVYFSRNLREDGPQITVVDSTSGKSHLITTNAATGYADVMIDIVDEDMPLASCVDFLDGYFIYSIKDGPSGRFQLSNLNDGASVNALDYATAESDPDELRRPLTRKGEAWMIGGKGIEVWANNGDALFPLIRLPGVKIDKGCKYGATAVVLEENVIWVDNAGVVQKAELYQGTPISHHGVARSLTNEPDKTSIQAFTITRNGHSLYVLVGSSFTWVYDELLSQKAGEPIWHERSSLGMKRWRAQNSVMFNDETVVGDCETGALYAIDENYGFEGVNPIVWKLIGPVQHDHPNEIQFFDLCLDLVLGVGKLDGSNDDEDPVVMMRYSDDGGSSWSSERRGRLGRVGERKGLVKFTNLGQCGPQGRIFEFSMSAAVNRGFMGANANVRLVKGR